MKERVRRGLETTLKCVLLFTGPALIGGLVALLWKLVFYRYGIHVEDGTKDIITTAVLPTLGILYGIIIASIVVATVWGEYKLMRTATKRYDLDTFMDLRDEELSPLIHMLMAVLSAGMSLGFLVLPYSSVIEGSCIIGGVSFFLALMYFVVQEVDDPCAGLWYIKSIPEEWEHLDPRTYRENRCRTAREKFLAKNGKKKEKNG